MSYGREKPRQVQTSMMLTRVGSLMVAVLLLAAVIGTSLALADDAGTTEPGDSAAELQGVAGSPVAVEPTPTDPEAAEELPHHDLGREEAGELLEGVFEPEVQGAAGIYSDLHVEKFLAPNVAVIAAGQQPEIPYGPEGDGSLRGAVDPGATLMESTRPLAIEGDSGRLEAVDLNLEGREGTLTPVNPLTEVAIPGELGDGIELPGPGIAIEPEGVAESRAPSTVGGTVAFYPNVSDETDLAIAPTLGGVETMTQIRSPESPRTEIYRLDLPSGASLSEEGAGAVVTRGGETLMTVAPPTALDAEGTPVPTELTVDGDRVIVEVSPSAQDDLPVLVDPIFESYEWSVRHNAWELGRPWPGEGWEPRPEEKFSAEGSTGIRPRTYTNQANFVPWGSEGLDVDVLGTMTAGTEILWVYRVPRYGRDVTERNGIPPETFISRMVASDLAWRAEGASYRLSPYMEIGLWGPGKGWASLATHEGNMGHSLDNVGLSYSFPNELNVPDVKEARAGIVATESGGWNDELFVGATTMELSEPATSKPEISKLSSPGWLNKGKAYVEFTVKDTGLGAYAISAQSEAPGAPTTPWRNTYGCTGAVRHFCPSVWISSLAVEPETLPTGLDRLNVSAEDPLGHTSEAGPHIMLAVDHTAPEVSLSGTATEQATLGAKRPSYTVKVNDGDGSAEHPQSGVAKVFIEFDGTVVKKSEPGCATENCTAPLEWTIESGRYTAGEHTIKVRVLDAAGNASTLERKITLIPSPPTVALSGSMTEQSSLGAARPRYRLRVTGSAEAGIASLALSPTYSASFGSAGTGAGQFRHPAGIARDAAGDLWVVDKENSRVEEFGPTGAYIRQVGSAGTGPGQLKLPRGIAIDPEGRILVADGSNHRIDVFDGQGRFLSSFGSLGSGNGQFGIPAGVAVAPGGDIWVADEGGERLEEFTAAGAYIRTVKEAAGKPLELVGGIAVSPEGDVWVVERSRRRLFEFDGEGNFIREVGSNGAGAGQFEGLSGALTVDTAGNVWVGDQPGRIEEFDSEGRYLAQFGSYGAGEGQMIQERASGIAVGPGGRIWVTDPGNNRIEKWTVTRPSPTYSASFGSAGTGAGQFRRPAGIARDAAGDLWVVDKENGRVEEFGPNGAYLGQFGSEGTGPGQLKQPRGIAIDHEGRILVADGGNHRIDVFDAQGHFVSSFGSQGSGNGQFSAPTGVAVALGGDIWVSDEGDERLEEFTAAGGWIRTVKQTAGGELWNVGGMAVSPEGDLWVVERGRGRVFELDGEGNFIREVGSKGTGNGQFEGLPGAIATDAAGNVWVGDRLNARFEEFDSEGRYLAQFGSSGTGEGQLSLSPPSGVAVGPGGRIWVADSGNNRVQEWTPTDPGSEVITEITLDGRPVEYQGRSCSGEHCPLTDEWTLESLSVAATKHEVAVTVSDGLGNSTTRTLPIEIQRDTTAPGLEIGGELADAPEGWVQQETYGVHASATDGGYGATSLVFKIDGQTVTSESAPCPDGGCGLSLSSQVDMAPYSGGAHKAEMIATDGAGNRNVNSWTINVDPEGRITTQEEKETLEAVEATSDQTPVAPTSQLLEPEQREGGDDPGLKVSGSEITSTGVPDVTKMTTDPEDGFSITSPEGTTTISPIVGEASSKTSIENGVAGVTANVAKDADSVFRPEYNGMQIAQAIRSEETPETFSWLVHLDPRQKLILVNPSQAEVVYTDGTEAFLITAEPAHDATGKPVPTSLAVNGNELTVRVEFRGRGFVYPILAGEGWETSYTVPVMVDLGEDETQIREREERELAERLAREHQEREEEAYGEGGEPQDPEPPPPANNRFSESEARRLLQYRLIGNEIIPAPEPSTPGGNVATASSIPEKVIKPVKTCEIDHCSIWRLELRNPSYWYGIVYVDKYGNNYSSPGRGRWLADVAGWHRNSDLFCESQVGPLYAIAGVSVTHPEPWCGFAGQAVVFAGEHKHLTAWGRFTVNANVWVFVPDLGLELFVASKNYALQRWVWPNGFQQSEIHLWDSGYAEA